jgi:hypothetical protein
MLHYAQTVAIVVAYCICFSCTTDNVPTPDTTGPEIIVISPVEDSKVKGTLTISASAKDQSNEIILQVSVDGILLKEETAKEIAATVDTRTVAEGVHEIKITATDALRNATTKIFNIEVRNILFTTNIPSHYVGEYTDIYFILSKNDGSLLAYAKIENGSTLSIATPENFNPDSTFIFTEFFHYNWPATSPGGIAYLINSVNIHAGMEAGQFSLPESQVLTKAGSHHLDVSGVPVSHIGMLDGEWLPNIAGYFGPDGIINIDFDMFNTTSDLYLTLAETPEGEPLYKYIESIRVGDITSFSFNEMTAMEKHAMTLSSANGDYQVYIDGFHTSSNDGVRLLDKSGSLTDGEIPLYVPGNSFPNYMFDVQVNFEGVSYRNNLLLATPPAALQELNTSISSATYANRKLTINPTGEFDVASLEAGTSSFENNVFKVDAYSVAMPSGVRSVVIPSLPEEVLNYGIPSADGADFNYASMFDYKELSGSVDYQQKIVFNSDNILINKREVISKHFMISTSSGGRIVTQRLKFPEELSSLKMHLPYFVF